MSVCILADAADIDRAKQIVLEYMSVDDLKKYVLYISSVKNVVYSCAFRPNKNRKLVKKLAKKYDAFLASEALIKQIPRLLGPGLSKGELSYSRPIIILLNPYIVAGKFPTSVSYAEDLPNAHTASSQGGILVCRRLCHRFRSCRAARAMVLLAQDNLPAPWACLPPDGGTERQARLHLMHTLLVASGMSSSGANSYLTHKRQLSAARSMSSPALNAGPAP